MKIVLITLSGSANTARTILVQRWPSATVEDMGREVLEEGGMLTRLRAVRGARPDVFAIMTESLDWQFGQDALLYFGALAGASISVIMDSRGDLRQARRAPLLTTSPFHITNAFLRGRRAFRAAVRQLSELGIADPPNYSAGVHARSKVVYLRTTPAAGTLPGGASSHIRGVVDGLRDLGTDVHVVANDLIAGVDRSCPLFHHFPPDQNAMPRAAFDVANGLSFAKRASTLVSELRPSFVYERYSRFSLAGVDIALSSGVPLFLEYNGSEVWAGKHWDATAKLDLLERYEDLNLRKATRIFVVSEVERQNLMSRGVDPAKIVVNPNGVDTEKFRPGVGGREIRHGLHVSDGCTLAGFLGTFGPWHGVLALADAISLTPRDSGLKFLFIGDGSLRSEVERKLAASGDLDRAIFVGSIPHEKVPSYLDACDILISPHVPLAGGAEFFGSPTKLFEYMAMGKGIVASRLGQIAEVLNDGETAALVQPANAQELSDAIQKLARDRDTLRRIGINSRAAAIDKHTWRANAQRVLDTYKELEHE